MTKNHGSNQLSADQYQPAIEAFTNAIKYRKQRTFDPLLGHIYFERAKCYVLIGPTEKAKKDFREAVRLNEALSIQQASVFNRSAGSTAANTEAAGLLLSLSTAGTNKKNNNNNNNDSTEPDPKRLKL